MSVAVCRSSAAPLHFHLEKEVISSMFEPITRTRDPPPEMSKKGQEPPGQADIWTMIQSQKDSAPAAPYVHPLVRRSSSLMSQQSLEMCTESLGSESGSDDFSSFFSDDDVTSEPEAKVGEEKEEIEEKTVVQQEKGSRNGRKELLSVNYHCSISSRRSPRRSFPPPLPSISRRDGPCIQMRPHRRDGRLVVEAVPVPSQNYLHARREHGRLRLSFINATSDQRCNEVDTITEMLQLPKDLKVEEQAAIEQESEEEDDGEELEEEEEEEEEVEVVDRGTMVEVKVSTQPQQQNGAMKVHRSSLVINKFVGGTPKNQWVEELPPPRRLATTHTTAAAAAVAASSVSASLEDAGERPPATDNKLLFTSKRRNREDLLHHMRRCSELRRPLFYFEPYCIATSS